MTLSKIQMNAVTVLLQDALADVSPEELPLLEHCFRPNPSESDPDGMLGFGLDAHLSLLLPVLLEVLKQLAETATGELAKAWGKQLAEFMQESIHSRPEPATFEQFEETVRARLEEEGFSNAEAVRASGAAVVAMVSHPEMVRNLLRR